MLVTCWSDCPFISATTWMCHCHSPFCTFKLNDYTAHRNNNGIVSNKYFYWIFVLLTSRFHHQIVILVLEARLRSSHRCCSTDTSRWVIWSTFLCPAVAALSRYYRQSDATVLRYRRPGNIRHPQGPKSIQPIQYWALQGNQLNTFT